MATGGALDLATLVEVDPGQAALGGAGGVGIAEELGPVALEELRRPLPLRLRDVDVPQRPLPLLRPARRDLLDLGGEPTLLEQLHHLAHRGIAGARQERQPLARGVAGDARALLVEWRVALLTGRDRVHGCHRLVPYLIVASDTRCAIRDVATQP